VKVADRVDLGACRADDEVAAGEDCLGGAASLRAMRAPRLASKR
jgi:hypothetical protein